jgi:hypothetical protein
MLFGRDTVATRSREYSYSIMSLAKLTRVVIINLRGTKNGKT